ncbi:MAG TPA: Na+/H+ antiporter NhaA [Methyloceanibacter sp.]|nr:Na+/H+ antiporter NhaA [Methyloceanibacter sp.]
MSQTARPKRPEFPAERFDAFATPFKHFLHTEAAGGIVLLLAAVAALVIANSAYGPAFEAFWQTPVGLSVGNIQWEHSLRHWINDGLVTLFFFVVGLEIKREVVTGELSKKGAIVLPFAAALGGMLVPAALYLGVAPEAPSGWGVVMATDIAFVVGCLALLGKRVPDSLRVFVLALAIIDDIGAILVIGIGYSHGFHVVPFLLALGGLGVTALMQWLGVRPVSAYWAVGFLTWAALHESGIHPTIAGVALGLLTPVRSWVDETKFDHFLSWARGTMRPLEGQPPEEVRRAVARAARESISPQRRLENSVHPWSAFVVLPLFALANAGVAIEAVDPFNAITLGVIAGLAIGKPVGIFLFAWGAVALGIARKPSDIGWPHMLGAGVLAGIGFTMALFIANLAFEGVALESAKFGILLASLIAGIVGMAMLLAVTARKPRLSPA